MASGFVRVVCICRPDSLIKSMNFDSRKGWALTSQPLQSLFDLFLTLRLERFEFCARKVCLKVLTGVCVVLKQANLVLLYKSNAVCTNEQINI